VAKPEIWGSNGFRRRKT